MSNQQRPSQTDWSPSSHSLSVTISSSSVYVMLLQHVLHLTWPTVFVLTFSLLFIKSILYIQHFFNIQLWLYSPSIPYLCKKTFGPLFLHFIENSAPSAPNSYDRYFFSALIRDHLETKAHAVHFFSVIILLKICPQLIPTFCNLHYTALSCPSGPFALMAVRGSETEWAIFKCGHCSLCPLLSSLGARSIFSEGSGLIIW